MFNKYTIVNAPDHRDALHDVSRSNREIANSIRDTSTAEIKSKDRVDITLEEYETMKRRIEILENDRRRIEGLLKKIDFPLIEYLENTEHGYLHDVKTEYCDDHINFRRKYRIEFVVDRFI